MNPRNLSRFRRLSVVTAVTTLVLVFVGALVRATGSGLGCLDEWPKCQGGWVAPLTYHAVIEYSHRFFAGIVVVLLVALVVGARRWMKEQPAYTWLSVGGLGTVVGQALLGRHVVTSGLHAALVTAHYVVALALVALTTTIAAKASMEGRPRADGSHLKVVRLAMGTLIALLPLLIVGAYVREKGAGLAFGDWPLMAGRIFPALKDTQATVMFIHRVLALVVALHLVGVFMRVRRDARSGVRWLGITGVALYFSQALVGAANVFSKLNPAAVLGHAFLAATTWAAFVALAVVAGFGRAPKLPTDEPPPPRSTGITGRVMAYVRLTKPRIITLLLITTVPAMVLAERGFPPLWLIGATLLGGMLTAGSANAFNQYLERDIDVKMERTKGRPLPSANVEPTRALIFAIAIGIAGFVWLWLVVNLLSALLAVAAIAFYVVVYTLLLKRNTPQNIVIGGAAGAAPVLLGWAAVTNTVGAPAWVMFAIVFLWTPPHFWALAMRYRDDYAAAGVPMMPVVRSDASTTFQILAYAIVLVASTLVLEPIGGLGVLYAAVAVGLGAWFIYRALRLRWDPTGQTAFMLFRYSITYLALLFAAIAVDRLMW